MSHSNRQSNPARPEDERTGSAQHRRGAVRLVALFRRRGRTGRHVRVPRLPE